DLLEVLLDERVDRLEDTALADVHRELERLSVLLEHAVRTGRPSGLREEILRLRRVVRVLRRERRVVVRRERRGDRRVRNRSVPELDRLDDRLAVDGLDERLTDANIGEARVRLIEREPVVLDERARRDDETARALHAVNGGLVVQDNDLRLARH